MTSQQARKVQARQARRIMYQRRREIMRSNRQAAKQTLLLGFLAGTVFGYYWASQAYSVRDRQPVSDRLNLFKALLADTAAGLLQAFLFDGDAGVAAAIASAAVAAV